MRIQHNIMAMNAYRNYNNNTSALAKNLEKLSSGYRINRAGDDAAGLAISEKMRAQITALGTAQKNVKDGISLVKTAEGATQEIHDMLNRMVDLATQSANGTYQDDVDRDAIQEEYEALRTEINRIADASNFNGIKLLNGDRDGEDKVTTTTVDAFAGKRMPPKASATDGAPEVGTVTFLDGAEATEAAKTKFTMDFSDLAVTGDGAGGFTDGTKDAGQTVKQTLADMSTGGNQIGTTNLASLKAITNLNVGGVTVSLANLQKADGSGAVNDTTTNTEVLAAIQKAVADAAAAADTAAAAGTTDYNKIDNITVAADGTTGFVVTYDSTPQTYTLGAGGFKASVTLNGAELANATDDTKVSTDVAVDADDTAKDIADKVFKAIGAADNNATVEVEVDGVAYNVTNDGNGVFTFEMVNEPDNADKLGGNYTWDVTLDGGAYKGSHTAGTNVLDPGAVKSAGLRANTVFEITEADLKDGTVINLDGKKVILSVGDDSKVEDGADVLKLAEGEDLNVALGKIAQKLGGETENFEVSVNRGTAPADDVKTGLAVYRKADSDKTYKTEEELGAVFSITTSTTTAATGKGLTLQIGEDSESYNQLTVNISDMHADALGIGDLDLNSQEGAQDAVSKIKDAINQVSTTRGRLGATQNRLEHTANNLSTMKENIQDAEATIRDTDIAEEMMAYTKNNILVQSAQAMLAQANQIPQGVLQLLG